jgi:hypothetical protein
MPSIYDAVTTEAQPAPAYVRRADYKKWYGYRGGENLGLFDSVSDAKAAGAVSTEEKFDQAGFDAAQAVYSAWSTKVGEEYSRRLRAEYPELNDAVYAIVYGQAWEDGHSAGHSEVENYMIGYADMAQRIIAAASK